MRDSQNQLFSVGYGESSSGTGNLNDYAYTAEAFFALAAVVDWVQPGDSSKWAERGKLLLDVVDNQFADSEGLGYFFVSSEQDELVHRKKDWYDNATPAGNSCLIHAHTALFALTGDSRSGKLLGQMETAYPGIMNTSPAAASHALSGLIYRAIGYAVIKVRPGVDSEELRRAIVEKPWRPVFILVDGEDTLPADYQLCVGTQCLAPTDSLEEVVERL